MWQNKNNNKLGVIYYSHSSYYYETNKMRTLFEFSKLGVVILFRLLINFTVPSLQTWLHYPPTHIEISFSYLILK